MAQYKALAQNTYKFVHEVTLKNNGEIEIPTVCNLPRIKVISDDRSVVEYWNLIPSNTVYTSTPTGYYDKTVASESTGSSWSNSYNGVSSYRRSVSTSAVIVDGVVYHGQKSCYYTQSYNTYASTTGGVVTLAGHNFPPAMLKTVVYKNDSGTIVAAETELRALSIPATTYAYTGGMASQYTYAYYARGIAVEKTTNDVVLAISIEYPKYTITLNGTGLQYSLNDGLTFNDVTEGLVLSDIEHVVFKNTSDTDISVGTTSGGSDICTIKAGTTYVAVPTESATWYIA